LSEILDAPNKPVSLPETVQWLAGQGAGSWFFIEKYGDEKNIFRVERFSPSGKLECKRIYKSILPLDLALPYRFSYLSHCALCTIIQKNKKIILNWIED